MLRSTRRASKGTKKEDWGKCGPSPEGNRRAGYPGYGDGFSLDHQVIQPHCPN